MYIIVLKVSGHPECPTTTMIMPMPLRMSILLSRVTAIVIDGNSVSSL